MPWPLAARAPPWAARPPAWRKGVARPPAKPEKSQSPVASPLAAWDCGVCRAARGWGPEAPAKSVEECLLQRAVRGPEKCPQQALGLCGGRTPTTSMQDQSFRNVSKTTHKGGGGGGGEILKCCPKAALLRAGL